MYNSYFQSIRNSRERNFLLFPSVRVSPFKLPSCGKTKRIQSNVLSFIFIWLHPSTSLSVSQWNKILSLSPWTPQILSVTLIVAPSLFLLSLSLFSFLRFFIRFYFVSQTRKRGFILLSQYSLRITSFLQRNDCNWHT